MFRYGFDMFTLKYSFRSFSVLSSWVSLQSLKGDFTFHLSRRYNLFLLHAYKKLLSVFIIFYTLEQLFFNVMVLNYFKRSLLETRSVFLRPRTPFRGKCSFVECYWSENKQKNAKLAKQPQKLIPVKNDYGRMREIICKEVYSW